MKGIKYRNAHIEIRVPHIWGEFLKMVSKTVEVVEPGFSVSLTMTFIFEKNWGKQDREKSQLIT